VRWGRMHPEGWQLQISEQIFYPPPLPPSRLIGERHECCKEAP